MSDREATLFTPIDLVRIIPRGGLLDKELYAFEIDTEMRHFIMRAERLTLKINVASGTFRCSYRHESLT